MNIEIVRENISKNIGKKVKVTVYGMRNKVNHYEGMLYKTYSNIFTIIERGVEKSFSYHDVITKEINIKYV